MRTVIENDLFDIVARLKSIDDSYFVVFDSVLNRFEVRSAERGVTSPHIPSHLSGTIAVIVPYDCLDARTIEHVRRTRAERMEKILKEIEQSNAKLERESFKRRMDAAAAEVFG